MQSFTCLLLALSAPCTGALKVQSRLAPASIPADVKQLADKWWGAKSDGVLSRIVEKDVYFHERTVKLHAIAGDDALSHVASEVFQRDVYGLYHSLASLDGKDPIVDVGANIGTFSIAAYLANPKMRILAVEPMPITYLCLMLNLKANGIPILTKEQFAHGTQGGVYAVPMGATADGRLIDIMYDPMLSKNAITNASTATRIVPQHTDVTTGNELRARIGSLNIARSLREMGIEKLSFFKIDCEGCEHEVVPTLGMVLQNSKYVASEVHPCLPGISCNYPPSAVSKTRTILCNVHCCTHQGARGSQTCNSAVA